MRSGVARTATKNAAKRLGTYLRGLRKGQGWTQSELAEMVEVDAVTIRRWELGMFSPSQGNSERLADIYGVGVEDLVNAANVERAQTDAADLPAKSYLGTEALQNPAGLPDDAVPVPKFIADNHPRSFSTVVRGNALTADGVHNGDVLIVDPELGPEVGSLAIVRIDGSPRATVCISATHYRLRTPTGRSEDLDASQIEFVGNVVWHIRRM
jgi:transcriptional regulator with XRE-family HTH domain